MDEARESVSLRVLWTLRIAVAITCLGTGWRDLLQEGPLFSALWMGFGWSEAMALAIHRAGAWALLLTTRRAPPLSPAMSRASAGALEHLPVARTPNLGRALELLKNQGFWALGADSNDGEDLFETPDKLWTGDLVVVLGAEGRGLRPGIANKLDHRVRIPMAGGVDSLNVSVAGSLLLFERMRRIR